MGSSFSHKVLEQHSNEIQQAIQFDLTQLVDELVVAGLVDMDTRNHLFNDPDADTARNARRLLTVVKGRVAQNPANFDKFTEALRESNQIDLAEKLERSARSELIVMSRKLFVGTYHPLWFNMHVWISNLGMLTSITLRNANTRHTYRIVCTTYISLSSPALQQHQQSHCNVSYQGWHLERSQFQQGKDREQE